MSLNVLARHRALQKRRREKRLAEAHQRHDAHRAEHPLPQSQLELNDVYLSKREHDAKVLREARAVLERLKSQPRESGGGNFRMRRPLGFRAGSSSSCSLGRAEL